ncbi:MAG: hypothetical protein QXL96_11975 [Ignisphaera sp.]
MIKGNGVLISNQLFEENNCRFNLNAITYLGTVDGGLPTVRDRGNGLEAQPVVYRWTNGAGWVCITHTSYEVMEMKAVNHKPMNRPRGTPMLEISLQGLT